MARTFIGLLLFCGLFIGAFTSHASAQVLRPGDTIEISVWQDPKLDRKVLIAPDGMISFPLAGHIRAGGKTTQALENILKQRLKKNYNGPLDITVSLAALNKEAQQEKEENKPRIFVTGEVLRPGPYVYRSHTSVVDALALAGGVGPFAATRRIQVHRKVRGVETTYLFNYNEYQSGVPAPHDVERPPNININLRPGDVIIVPERGLFE